MKWPISHSTWQTLRVLVRNKNRPLPGRALRVVPSRATKDGTFLDELVQIGLLEVVTAAAPASPKAIGEARAPAQFRTTYRLTERGKDAAEFGEFERPDPRPLPVIPHRSK